MATSGHALFDRRCRVTIAVPIDSKKDFKSVTRDVIEIDGGSVGAADVVGMRVQFRIAKTLKKEPNSSEIVISNLSPARRSSLQKIGVQLLLEAGYKDTGVSRYFSGDVRTVDHVRNDANWDTTMKLGDGSRAWRFARVNESFAPGANKGDVLKTLAEAMGLDLGNVASQASGLSGTFDQGFAAVGSAGRAIDMVVQSLGKEWSVQDGKIQILDPYEVLDLPIPEIGPDSGLVGSPEMGSPPKKGKPALVKFKCLLTPTKPGAKIKLKSLRYDGYVRVQAVRFTGDTHGGDWYSEIDGVLLK